MIWYKTTYRKVCKNMIHCNSKHNTVQLALDFWRHSSTEREKNQLDSVKTRDLTGKTGGKDRDKPKSKHSRVWDIRDKKKCLYSRHKRETTLQYCSPGSMPMRVSTAAGSPVQTLWKFERRAHVENLTGRWSWNCHLCFFTDVDLGFSALI